MKRILQITVISLAAIFLMPDGLSGQTTTTSTTTATTKEKEAIQKASDEQKKAQEELNKAKAEQKKAEEEFVRSVRVSEYGGTRGGTVDVFGPDGNVVIRSSQQGGSNYYFSRSPNSTSLDFSRNVTDNSATKEYTFDVEKEMKVVSLSISGSCKAGEIKISIIMPGNKEYSTVMIDEVGSMSWKKTFELTEEDAKDKVGTWKFKVVTAKATGNFRLSLSGS